MTSVGASGCVQDSIEVTSVLLIHWVVEAVESVVSKGDQVTHCVAGIRCIDNSGRNEATPGAESLAGTIVK